MRRKRKKKRQQQQKNYEQMKQINAMWIKSGKQLKCLIVMARAIEILIAMNINNGNDNICMMSFFPRLVHFQHNCIVGGACSSEIEQKIAVAPRNTVRQVQYADSLVANNDDLRCL